MYPSPVGLLSPNVAVAVAGVPVLIISLAPSRISAIPRSTLKPRSAPPSLKSVMVPPIILSKFVTCSVFESIISVPKYAVSTAFAVKRPWEPGLSGSTSSSGSSTRRSLVTYLPAAPPSYVAFLAPIGVYKCLRHNEWDLTAEESIECVVRVREPGTLSLSCSAGCFSQYPKYI